MTMSNRTKGARKKKRARTKRRRQVYYEEPVEEEEEEITPSDMLASIAYFFGFHIVSAKIISLFLFRQQIRFEWSDLPFYVYQEFCLGISIYLLNRTTNTRFHTRRVIGSIFVASILILALSSYTILDNIRLKDQEQISGALSLFLSLALSLFFHGSLWMSFHRDFGLRFLAICSMFLFVVCLYIFAGVLPSVTNITSHPHLARAVPMRYVVPLWKLSNTLLSNFGYGDPLHRVAFLIPWFGNLPDALPYTLFTFGSNNNFADFYIFVEAPEVLHGFKYEEREVLELMNLNNLPSNVFARVYPPFEIRKKMVEAAQSSLGQLVDGLSYRELTNGKMQTDYTPFFPVVFEDFFQSNYSHWGWIDISIMLGNISKFIPQTTLETFDVITLQDQRTNVFLSGALTIFKSEIPNLWKYVDSQRFANSLKVDHKKYVHERLFSYAILKTESLSVLISCSRESDEKMIESSDVAWEKGALYVYFHSSTAKDNFAALLRRTMWTGTMPIVWPSTTTVIPEDEKQATIRRSGYNEYYRTRGQSRWVGRTIAHLIKISPYMAEISAYHIWKSWRPQIEDPWYQPLLVLPAEEDKKCHIDILADWILNFVPRPCFKHDWSWHQDPTHFDYICRSESAVIDVILDSMEAVAMLDSDVFLAEGSLISALRWGSSKREDDDMDFLVRAKDRAHWEQVIVPAIAIEFARRGFSLEPISISTTGGKGFRFDKVSVMSPFRCHTTAIDIHSCMFTEDKTHLYSQRTCAGVDKLTAIEVEPCVIAAKYPFSKWDGSIDASYFYPVKNCSFYGRISMCPNRGGELLKLWNWGEYSKGCIALPDKKITVNEANNIRDNILKLDAKGFASFAPQVADETLWEECKREAQIFGGS